MVITLKFGSQFGLVIKSSDYKQETLNSRPALGKSLSLNLGSRQEQTTSRVLPGKLQGCVQAVARSQHWLGETNKTKQNYKSTLRLHHCKDFLAFEIRPEIAAHAESCGLSFEEGNLMVNLLFILKKLTLLPVCHWAKFKMLLLINKNL